LNKIDLVSKFDKRVLNKFNFIETTQKDENYEIEKAIEKILDSYQYQDNMLISNRQVEVVEAAYNAIINSFELIEMQELELFSYNIQDAVSNIGKITKPYEHDEVLDKMFGSFCVGK